MKRVAAHWAVRAGICVLGSGLAGCAGGGDNIFSAQHGDNDSTLGNLLAFNTTNPGPVPPPINKKERPIVCPEIEVQDGTSSARTYAGADQSNSNVRYQFSLGDIARECAHVGNQIVIKVGAEGRVLLGPAGAPGNFSVPLRIVIRRDKDQKPAAGKLYQIAAAIPVGATETSFSLVADPLSVPYLQPDANVDYTILVGFDTQSKAVPVKRAPETPNG